jgi:hypothetical protein
MMHKPIILAVGDIIAKALLLAAALGVPIFFANSSYIANGIGRLLRLEVEPSLSGGITLAEFADPLGDDDGSGKLEYPLGGGISRGELDIVRYAVRAPVSRPVWGETGAYWQLELSFAKAVSTGLAGGGFRAPAIHIYIGIDGTSSGSIESAFGEGELVRFDPKHPWNYVVSADGWSPKAAIRSADASYRAPVESDWDIARRRVTLRIGLAKAPRLLASLLAGRRTWHYVMVGAYDGARAGRFAAVREFAGPHEGGGAADELCPRVFDLIAPAGARQESELASEDSGRGELALVLPVEAEGAAGLKAKPSAVPRARESLVAEAAREEARAKVQAKDAREREARASSSASDKDKIGTFFELGLDDRALAAANAALARNARNFVALAYRGAIVARSAMEAKTLGEKMRLVARGYDDLDAAVAVAKAEGAIAALDKIAVFLCRASVSSAVPNDVFERAAQGASDFAAAGALAASEGDKALEARCLEGAALAFEKAGLGEEAQARWATLAAKEGLPAATRLELMDKGFTP